MFQAMLLGTDVIFNKLFLGLKVMEHVIFQNIQQGFDDSSVGKCLTGATKVVNQIQDDFMLVVDESDTDIQFGIPCIKLSHVIP